MDRAGWARSLTMLGEGNNQTVSLTRQSGVGHAHRLNQSLSRAPQNNSFSSTCEHDADALGLNVEVKNIGNPRFSGHFVIPQMTLTSVTWDNDRVVTERGKRRGSKTGLAA